MSKKTFNGRSKDEQKEGYETVQTEMPSERFQTEKQVLTPNQLGVTDSSIPGNDKFVTTSNVSIDTAKKVKSKMKIRPDVSVDELENKQVGGVPLAGSTMTRSVAGFSTQSPADDTSKIPYSNGKYRPDSRYGKKRSEDLFEMDNTISEQVIPIVEDSLDLREAPEAKQGYNGRKQFKQTRAKKNFQFVNDDLHVVPKVPQQLLNDASVDFIETSKLIYTTGQVINGNIDPQADYPTRRDKDVAVAHTMHKSNYIPKSLNITVSNNKISGICIDEDCHNVAIDPVGRDQANMNWQVDANNVAKAMIKMQTELGRETTEKWSPLGYVITNPYEYNMLMHDIEATVGAISALSYRASVSSMAFQRNILGKDGVNPQSNAIKMITEGYAGTFATTGSEAFSTTDFGKVIFNSDAFAKGSVAALIDMFDSTQKYRTKADILGMQRSLALHLSQADNNISPFHCKPSFIHAMDKAHMFSTIDGSYNPMLPIFTTRKIKIANPLSLNFFLAGWKNPADFEDYDFADPLRDQQTGTLANYSYQYKDIRNVYKTRVQHPLVEGLIRWLLKHEGAFCSTFPQGVNIPFEFNMESPSLLEFMICSATQDIAWERNICFRDILFAGEQSTYVWDDLQPLSDLNPLFSSQLTIGKYDEPLKLGKLSSDTAIREFWNGQMQLSDVSGGKAQFYAPWYMNERAFEGKATGSYTANEGFFNEPTAFNMSIPSIRDGVRHEYVDLIKGLDERDIRLSLDRWITIPVFTTSTDESVYIDGSSVKLYTTYSSTTSSDALNKYIKMATVRYDGNSDGRLILQYDLTSGSNRSMDHHSLMCVPKEIGFIDDDYYGDCAINNINGVHTSSVQTVSLDTTPLLPYIYLGTSDTAPVYNGYSPLSVVSYRVAGVSNSNAGIDRSVALSQKLYRCYACSLANTINTAFVEATGIIPCYSYNDGLASDLKGVYNIDSAHESTVSGMDLSIRSNAARIWSMIQRLFLPINRFENCFTLKSSSHSYDPLENCFYFGLCGTLASDYTQDILERLDIYDQLGLDYTEDVFVKDSLIFR